MNESQVQVQNAPLVGRRRLLQWGAAGSLALVSCGTRRGARSAAPAHLGAGAAEVAGVSSQPAAPAPRGAPEEVAQAGIQELLDRQAEARANGDKAAFTATIDQENLTWRRIQSETFDARLLPTSRLKYEVTRVQSKQDGYYKAWIDIKSPTTGLLAYQGVWVFRQAPSGWLQTEILNEEIGSRLSVNTEHFRLAYFAWDEDVIQRIGDVAERAFAAVLQRVGTAPGVRVTLSVNPTYGAHSGLRGLGTWAAYDPGAKDTLLIRSIESYGAGLISPGESQEDRLLVAVTHELTHLVNDQIVPIVKVPQWASEGLAEYVANNMRSGQVSDALRSGRTLTLDKASEIIEWGTDPSHGFSQSDVSLAYGFSAHGVQFFVERFGQDLLFALERSFAESRRWPASFSGITGEEWEQFQAAWSDWLRRRFGG